MAFSTKFSSLLFLLTLLFSYHTTARESQFFSKIPSNSNSDAAKLKAAAEEIQRQEEGSSHKPENYQNFIPENENGGFDGKWSGQFPSVDAAAIGAEPGKTTTTTTTPTDSYLPYLPYNNGPNEYLPKYLPKNYNTESYVTEPEGYHGNLGQENTKNYHTAEDVHYNIKRQSGSTAGGNNYDEQQQELNDFGFAQKQYTPSAGNINGNYYNAGDGNAFEKQGMSDTRFLENGKYFYDINLGKNGGDPYGNTQEFGYNKYGNGGYYSNRGNPFEYKNSVDGYENKEQFEDFKFEGGFP